MAPAVSWLHLAILSGCSAACNGFFAKLTTGNSALTHSVINSVNHFFGASDEVKWVEWAVRGFFFALNMLFDSIMWGLFTAALARGSSATTVSVVNTSSNFLVAAFLGWSVFQEALPLQWWAGATLLVIGNIVISRQGEEEKKVESGDGYMPLSGVEGVDDGEGESVVVGGERRSADSVELRSRSRSRSRSESLSGRDE